MVLVIGINTFVFGRHDFCLKLHMESQGSENVK
jgi:hypothetical protein